MTTRGSTAPPVATTVDYYVAATDRTGRAAAMPRVAPSHWYTFPIDPDPATAAQARARALTARAFPNPFRESTRLSFELRSPDRVCLTVHDVRGRLVRTLEDGVLGSGVHELEWNGRDESGWSVAAGVYYFRLRAAGLAYTRPVVLTR